MPVVADKERNFITGLSDFWVAFFKDTAQLRSIFDGVQISLGQVYLDLLQTVLGTSLKHIPLFSKDYFKLFTVRERDINFIEGVSPGANRFSFTPAGDSIHEVPSLMNKVIEPTRVLNPLVDYEVVDGSIHFVRDIFNVDGQGNSEPQFPVRVVQEDYPAEYNDPLSTDWTAAAVHTGDTFRFKLSTGSFLDIRIAGLDRNVLLLDQDLTEIHAPLGTRTWKVHILRVPSNAHVIGEVVANHPRSVSTFTNVVPQSGTTTVNSPSAATSWVGKYLYLFDLGNNPTNNGFYRVNSVIVGVSATLARSFSFGTPSVAGTEAHLVDFGANIGNSPITSLNNTFVDASSFELAARRLFDRTVNGVLYPAGQEVLEGIDYQFEGDTGRIAILSVWNPLYPARSSYTWLLEVATASYNFRRDINNGEWLSGTTYQVGDIVTVTGADVIRYVCIVTHVAGGTFDATEAAKFKLFVEPFSFEQVHTMREIPFWAPDVLVDHNILFTNFGYLLSFQKPSSESYRAFLRGVSQLFLIGPTLERFESALNVMAGYPVIRDDGEVLIDYDDGIVASGNDGQFIDTAESNNGSLFVAGSVFTSATANFYPSDIGALLHIRNGVVFDTYVITAVTSTSSVTVSPTPTADATNVQWTYSHNNLTRRFRVTAGSYNFTQEDVNAVLVVREAANQRNVGTFRIVAVENVSTVILESTYGFSDETGVSWQLSRTQIQVVTTSRDSYEIPLLAPIHPNVSDPASIRTLVFQAFDTLTEAFVIEDYIRNPTWWHDITIPQELLQLDVEVPGRRRVTPQLIEHVYNALDQAVYGDLGLAYGRDDEGKPGLPRRGELTWYGGDQVVFEVDVEQGADGTFSTSGNTFTTNTGHFDPSDVGGTFHFQAGAFVVDDATIATVVSPNQITITAPSLPGFSFSFCTWRYAHRKAPHPRPRDVGNYLTVYGRPLGGPPPVIGFFKVLAVANDEATLTLERWPPPELLHTPTPVRFAAELPPLLYRHTVAFILMDQFLKYHAFRIKIDKNTPLTTEFVSEVTTLIREARPSYTFVYLEPVTSFFDKLTVSEVFSPVIRPSFLDQIFALDSHATYNDSGRLRYNDCYRYISSSTSLNTTITTPQVISPPSPPGSGTFRSYFLFGRFALALTMSNGKRPVEGTDYTFNYDTGTFQIPVGSTLLGAGGGTGTFHVVVVHMRFRNTGDPLDSFETQVVYNGMDPTYRLNPAQNPFTEGGLVDRALQINIV